MLDEESTSGVIVIESVNEEQAKRADEAMEALASLLKNYFDITPDQQVVLNAQNPSVTVK